MSIGGNKILLDEFKRLRPPRSEHQGSLEIFDRLAQEASPSSFYAPVHICSSKILSSRFVLRLEFEKQTVHADRCIMFTLARKGIG